MVLSDNIFLKVLFENITDNDVISVQNILNNNRPKKTTGFLTPIEFLIVILPMTYFYLMLCICHLNSANN
ncbi:MAG: hypothetical protein R2771_10040 [Saprospiraceae bacterium]